MRARLLLVAVATLVLSVGLRAQTGNTADGVDALLRRDYARAAAILKPLAETPWQPDHTAEFFMAVLYESGLGVPQDPLRACALFMLILRPRRSARHCCYGTCSRPPARARLLCRARATGARRPGFDDRFEPVHFMLDQAHWIAFDLKGTTIAYQGVDKRIAVPLVFRPVRFVAIRHARSLNAGCDVLDAPALR